MPREDKAPVPPIVQAGMITAHVTSGPLPSAAEVRQYEEILPGAFDRILKMAEANQTADIEIKKTQLSNASDGVKKQFISSIWAMIFAFSLCGCSLAVGGYLVLQGYQLAGTAFSAPCFIAILRYFLAKPNKK